MVENSKKLENLDESCASDANKPESGCAAGETAKPKPVYKKPELKKYGQLDHIAAYRLE